MGANVRSRQIFDTVAPVGVFHFGTRLRYLGDGGSGTYVTLFKDFAFRLHTT